MQGGSLYRQVFWNGKTNMRSFMLLFLLLIQQFCFTNHNLNSLNFTWFKHFTFISAELFCCTIRPGKKSRSWKGCNSSMQWGAARPLCHCCLHLSGTAVSQELHPLRIRTGFWEKQPRAAVARALTHLWLQVTSRQLNPTSFAPV